jgi:hypothetical protein
MFESLTKAGRRRIALDAMKQALMTSSLQFSSGVLDKFDDILAMIASVPKVQLDYGERQYPRFMIKSDNFKYGKFHYFDQYILLVEGVALFSHYISRISYKIGGDTLRERFDEPVISPTVELIVNLISVHRAIDKQVTFDKIINYIGDMEELYSSAQYLFIEEEPNSLLNIAASHISDMIWDKRDRFIIDSVRLSILEQVHATDYVKLVRDAAARF